MWFDRICIVTGDILGITKRHRIAALDLLRGFFLFAIIVNHLQRFPNGFDFITGRGSLWISAAEGFMTISGILIGYIYGPKMLRNSKETWKKLWKRAGKIYLCVLSLSLFFMVYSYAVAAIPENTLEFVKNYNGNLDKLIFDSLTLQYVFGWGEFLSHYVIFLIISPFILWLITRHKYSFIPIIVVSIFVWILAFHPFEARGRYDFTLSWQLIFVVGIIIGYYLPAISRWFRSTFKPKSIHSAKLVLYVSAGIIAMSSLLLTWGNTLIGDTIPSLMYITSPLQQSWNVLFETNLAVLLDKTSLGPLRLLFGAIIFWALFMAFNDYGSKIHISIRNFLQTLGEKSLFVYCLQAFVVFFVGLYIVEPTSYKEYPILNTGVTLLALIVTYQITKNTIKFHDFATRIILRLKTSFTKRS